MGSSQCETSAACDVADLVITTVSGRVALPDRWVPFLSRGLREPDGFVTVQRGTNSYAHQPFGPREPALYSSSGTSPFRHARSTGSKMRQHSSAMSARTDSSGSPSTMPCST